jgi:DNA-directed RNA polymerase subunit beta'
MKINILKGLITRGEKYNKVVDAWSKCTDKVAGEMMKGISATEKTPEGLKINSVYMMADSGARGSAGTDEAASRYERFDCENLQGEIIESPIISNFKEGLTALEYFNSTHGARKGLADTALKTASSGYLTRRLCDVAQDLTITKVQCDDPGFIELSEILEGGNVVVSLS